MTGADVVLQQHLHANTTEMQNHFVVVLGGIQNLQGFYAHVSRTPYFNAKHFRNVSVVHTDLSNSREFQRAIRPRLCKQPTVSHLPHRRLIKGDIQIAVEEVQMEARWLAVISEDLKQFCNPPVYG